MYLCFLIMKSNFFGFLGYAEHARKTFTFTHSKICIWWLDLPGVAWLGSRWLVNRLSRSLSDYTTRLW